MNVEVEVRYLASDVAALKQELSKRGALVKSARQVDSYFNRLARIFMQSDGLWSTCG
ncbi:TPA: hypothetical protein HA318_01730 [Candidatus Micrarchaeota archaeon]|nr:hypothetical protein [Candidatus Micrarchaeota archaeon]